ncbi:MAG TPA: hypothetical protein DIU35_09535 [Candidatus Latescibacteria bacterium]|nr:hypothetical protein [Candidatus Latescibacterota bacterium]
MFNTTSDIPGLGIALTLVEIWLAGLLPSNVLGKRLIDKGDTLLTRAPLIGSIYSPVKQFIETVVSLGEKESFNRVVLTEYPSDWRWMLGFVTGEIELDDAGNIGKCVFVPTLPNPATGWTVIFLPDKVRNTRLSVEKTMRLIVSSGLVIPDALKTMGNYDLREEVLRCIPTDPNHDKT